MYDSLFQQNLFSDAYNRKLRLELETWQKKLKAEHRISTTLEDSSKNLVSRIDDLSLDTDYLRFLMQEDDETTTTTFTEDPELKIWRIRYKISSKSLIFSAEVEKTKKSTIRGETKEELWTKMQQLEDEIEIKKQVEMTKQQKLKEQKEHYEKIVNDIKNKLETDLAILKSNFDIQTIQLKRALDDQVELKIQLEKKYKKKLNKEEIFSQKEIYEDLLRENSRQLEEQKDINSALEVKIEFFSV